MKHGILVGCWLLLHGSVPYAAEDAISGYLFVQGNEDQSRTVSLPISTLKRIRLFDREISYRNDKKACVTFELPALGKAASNMILSLQAYNDDRRYLRAIWFEVDGVGGYLAVREVAPGEHRGGGTINPGQHKSWRLPLDRFAVSLKGEVTTEVNFQEMLQAPGSHTLCSWISTYREHGPDSWITLDLVMEGGVEAVAAPVPAPALSGAAHSTREQVAFHISNLGDPSYVDHSGHGEHAARRFYLAPESLGTIGLPAIPPLIRLIGATEDDYERTQAFYALRLAVQHENATALIGETTPYVPPGGSDHAFPAKSEHGLLLDSWNRWWGQHGETIMKHLTEGPEV